MRAYEVEPGDSPAKIAIKYAGCPKCTIDLVRANPHKRAVVHPNGFQTFESLKIGEVLNLPAKWFDGSMDALPKSYYAALPHADGRTPGALSQEATVLDVSPTLLGAAQNAAAALAADPNYCASVGQVGSAVNAAVHAFKAEWNASQPSKVPINTGKYEAPTANALADIVGSAPPSCDGLSRPAPTPTKKDEGLSTAAIAGIGLVGAGAVAGLVYWLTKPRIRVRQLHP
jgi:hypothetical protein